MDNSFSGENSTKKPDPFWLRPSADLQCAAKSKQSGQRCKRYASPGKRVCHFHGGRSTGPRKPAIKHGETTLEAIKMKIAGKVKSTADKELFTLKYGFSQWAEDRLAIMDYPEFRRVRPALAAFVRGELSAIRLTAVIEGKLYHHKRQEVGKKEE